MAKGVFTIKKQSIYQDDPTSHYQFPDHGAYLRAARACIGDFVIFYEPSAVDIERRDRSGRKAYFAMARVEDVVPDSEVDGYWRAVIEPGSFQQFLYPVPLKGAGGYFERRMASPRGGASRGLTGLAVRNIEYDEYQAIVDAAFQPSIIEQTIPEMAKHYELAEDAAPYERPIIERVTARPFRDRAFTLLVQEVYDKRCAVTGLALVNGGGRAEIEAAHIQAVEDKGPDFIGNGLALTRTFHWLFDRGLMGFDDDYRIRVAREHVDPRIANLIRPEGVLDLPKDRASWPARHFLRLHREKFAEKAKLWT